jgi:hypothetical protein
LAVRDACSGPQQPGDEVEREVLPRRHATGRDQPVGLAREIEDRRRPKADLRVGRLEQLLVRPVARTRPTVEQPGLGQQEGAGADRGDQRSAGVHLAQPLNLAWVATVGRHVDRLVEHCGAQDWVGTAAACITLAAHSAASLRTPRRSRITQLSSG